MSYQPTVESSGEGARQFAQMSMEDMFDLAEPQPRYKQMIEDGGFFELMPNFYQSASRETTEFVLRHHELFSSAGALDLGNVRPLIPLNIDPPQHTKYRKILDPIFAPRQMEAIEDDVTARVNHFIDAFIDKGECNFSEEYAELFPSSVFLGLMGLPWDELDSILEMRDGILRPQKFDPDAAIDPDKRLAVNRKTGQQIYDYFNQILDQRMRDPKEDILTRFLNSEIDGEKLTREEILDICFLFLIAGLDTVSDSLTCFYAFLARSPEHRRQIVENPAIIPSAVEELLRWESPVPGGVPRVARQDVDIDGRTLPEGSVIVVSYGAANVDPTEFPDGFEVRFDREPNRHIAFGGGVHRCLGSHLARRELRITLREWHRRIPDYSIKPGHEELVYPPGLRSVKDLMLVWPSA